MILMETIIEEVEHDHPLRSNEHDQDTPLKTANDNYTSAPLNQNLSSNTSKCSPLNKIKNKNYTSLSKLNALPYSSFSCPNVRALPVAASSTASSTASSVVNQDVESRNNEYNNNTTSQGGVLSNDTNW